MVTSTSAIVLSKIRYKDNDIIVKSFTKEYGAISFIVRGGQNSKKNKIKYVYFQELTILEIQFNYNSKRDLQYIVMEQQSLFIMIFITRKNQKE